MSDYGIPYDQPKPVELKPIELSKRIQYTCARWNGEPENEWLWIYGVKYPSFDDAQRMVDYRNNLYARTIAIATQPYFVAKITTTQIVEKVEKP